MKLPSELFPQLFPSDYAAKKDFVLAAVKERCPALFNSLETVLHDGHMTTEESELLVYILAEQRMLKFGMDLVKESLCQYMIEQQRRSWQEALA